MRNAITDNTRATRVQVIRSTRIYRRKMKSMNRTTLFLLLLFLIQHVNSQSGPVVQTSNGAVQGAYNYTVWENIKFSSFKTIPYAKPPLGSLRFQPPIPADPWEGILDATREPPPCPQLEDTSSVLMGNEDCLYINVYSPVTNFTGSVPLKPVMVWIYGGSFRSGEGGESTYGPRFLMEHDVVVVTFNYRIGILGFISLNHPRALGNAGLKDQYLALQWVNQNIAAFGGDPKQVTIFGESAGAVSVGYHVLSNKASGLFSKAILMSGTPLCQWAHQTAAEAYNNAYQLAVLLGHVSTGTDDLLDFLSKQPALLLANTTGILEQTHPVPFRPTIENTAIDYNDTAYVTQCSTEKYQSGNFNKVPTLMGYTHDEALFFLYHVIEAKKSIQETFQYYGKLADWSDPVIASIFNVSEDVGATIFIRVGTDLFFISPIDETQKLLAANNDGQPIYYYRQSYEAPHAWHDYINVPYNGVGHFDDIPYIWETNVIPVPTDPNDPYYQYIHEMVGLFANFAKYGNPTPKGNSPINITWTPSGLEGLQADLNTTSTMNNRLADITALMAEPLILLTCN
ncbi:Juvenile hormone esterase [Anthophora plagiata]